MARKLKTYTTSAGFFDLAVAAPSMKAALEAWGARSDLFNQGFAKVSDDRAIVTATMARPGVVLRRPVGSTGAYSEHADLPRNLPVGKARRAAAKPPSREKPPAKEKKQAKPPAKAVDDKVAAKAAAKAEASAALAFEKEQQRRDSERRKEEAAHARERQRRERATAAAQAALDEAARDHEERAAEIDKARAALDRKSQAEDARWRRKKEDLEAALRRARSVSYLRPV